jgi:hypothetical protein
MSNAFFQTLALLYATQHTGRDAIPDSMGLGWDGVGVRESGRQGATFRDVAP